ncbi:hypothetical protein Leryth_001123 [Lithospermum erythrorhizon]|nr:hypothetical protein Leryth_001123 [Lithospermum erythrorhizon]
MAQSAKAISSPVPESLYPMLAFIMLSLGLIVTAAFFIYEATTSRKNRSLAKELTTGSVASVFLGFVFGLPSSHNTEKFLQPKENRSNSFSFLFQWWRDGGGGGGGICKVRSAEAVAKQFPKGENGYSTSSSIPSAAAATASVAASSWACINLSNCPSESSFAMSIRSLSLRSISRSPKRVIGSPRRHSDSLPTVSPFCTTGGRGGKGAKGRGIPEGVGIGARPGVNGTAGSGITGGTIGRSGVSEPPLELSWAQAQDNSPLVLPATRIDYQSVPVKYNPIAERHQSPIG